MRHPLRSMLTGLFVGLAALALTLLTQVGGVVLLVAFGLAAAVARRRSWTRPRRLLTTVGLFLALYAATSLAIVPPLARLGGRVPLPCPVGRTSAPVAPLTSAFCALNRHYAAPQVARLLEDLSQALSRRWPGTEVRYLDAGFPFAGLPLLPHVSHADGRKVDLAFFYQREGRYVPGRARSPIGYWGFESPAPGDRIVCRGRVRGLDLRWDLAWLQDAWPDVELDATRTGAMLRWLSRPGRGVSRIFLEPYLADRLRVTSPRVRFQGCRAARHDDHLHVEVEG